MFVGHFKKRSTRFGMKVVSRKDRSFDPKASESAESILWYFTTSRVFIRRLRSSQSPLVVTQDAHHLLLVLLPLLLAGTLYRMFE